MTPAAPDRREVRIVLVDDTPDLRLLLRVVLETQPGFRIVAEAGDGASGVDAVRRNQPDVVLLDLAMPVMDGLEALPRLRAASPASRVIVLSGFESARMASAAIAEGAHDYVQKGATPDEIVATIARALDGTGPAVLPQPVVAAAPAEPPTELEELQAALATAAHELRSPATILVGLGKTLSRRRDSLNERTISQLLDAIVRQTQVLDRVTSDLLTASQSSRAAVVVDVQLALSPTFESAALAMREQAELLVDCPADVWVRADRVRVDQMLGNLVSNAVKYGKPPVQLVAGRAGSQANVQVKDAGPGVPEDFRPRLFQQYARAHGLRASGTGLGLFVVRSLAEAQGGTAWYEPLDGGGSSFCFSLPLAAEEDHVAR